MLNLVTVCVDAYPMIYAMKLHRRFQNVSNLKVAHWCITDRPDELPDFIQPIEPFKKSKGWWNKINLYSPKMPEGDILYMDLDIVILKNFDQEIIKMTEHAADMCCVSDAIGWMGEKFSSSLMCFKSGANAGIFKRFEKEEAMINNLAGGDQVWTGPLLQSIYYIDETFPNLKKNLKFHLAKNINNELCLPISVCDQIKLIDCGGQPKPHQLEGLPYIKNNWHLV